MSNNLSLFSVFDFEDHTHLFSFLHEQQKAGRTIYFENEDLTILPETSIETSVTLSCYMAVKCCPEIVKHYIDWLVSKNSQQNDSERSQGQHEPILK